MVLFWVFFLPSHTLVFMKREKEKGIRKRKRKRESCLKASVLKLINTFVVSLLMRKVLLAKKKKTNSVTPPEN